MRLPLLVVLLACILVANAWEIPNLVEFDKFQCDIRDQLPITWASPLGACGLDGNVYYNALGNSTLSSVFLCMIKSLSKPNPNIGFSYPGYCGCPNSCSNATANGNCIGGSCQCGSGWSGPDCSQGKLIIIMTTLYYFY